MLNLFFPSIKERYLRCIPLCFGVCLSFFCFFFWLYCITTATPFILEVTTSNDEVKAGHFYLAAESRTSRNKNAAFLPKFKSAAKFSSSSPRGKPLFPLWEITRHFAQSARRGEEKTQLPTLLAQQRWELSVLICARVAAVRSPV